MKKEADRKHWIEMFKSITNPEEIKKRIRIEEIRKRREDKIKDTGL